MSTATAASLINFLGFITGTVLYVMLLWMVLSSRRESNRLLLSAGLLGFAWSVGAFGGYGLIRSFQDRIQRYGAKTTALRVETAPGLGTTVEVWIPVKRAEAAATV
jgi:uncharacterized membrane protein YdcZ (DUF606 family)